MSIVTSYKSKSRTFTFLDLQASMILLLKGVVENGKPMQTSIPESLMGKGNLWWTSLIEGL